MAEIQSAYLYIGCNVLKYPICILSACVNARDVAVLSKHVISWSGRTVRLARPTWPEGRVEQTFGGTGMSGGAYCIKPDRRIRHLHDILTSGPRTFDVVVVGAGRKRDRRHTRYTVVDRLE